MMIDATVAPKVGFISPFGTTVCNVNHINTTRQPRPEAGAQRSNCLDCQEALGCEALDPSRGCHGGISLTMACMSVNRVGIQAMQATFLRVPAARRRA
jgi:hypothetical protein